MTPGLSNPNWVNTAITQSSLNYNSHLSGTPMRNQSHVVSRAICCKGTLNWYLSSDLSESPSHPVGPTWMKVRGSEHSAKSNTPKLNQHRRQKLWITVLTVNIEVKILLGTSSYVFCNADIPASICYLGIQNLRQKKRQNMALELIYRQLTAKETSGED